MAYVYQPYPKWIDAPHGRMIVKDREHHEQVTGLKLDENGNEIKRPTPPSLETVLAAGYQEPRASQIVAEEQEKFEKGYKPYGDIEPPAANPPAPVENLPVQPPPAVEAKSSLDEPPKEPVKRGPGRPPKAAVAESKAW